MVSGRLASFVDTWKMLTKDTWVLNAIEGYQIPLVGTPTQLQIPQKGVFSQEHKALLLEEMQELLQKGAIIPQSGNATGFVSILFLVPKKNGQMRVINLKRLNHWVETPHFKMEGIPTLQDLLRQGDWIVKVDLKDAYFTIPIHQKYLRFMVDGTCYQFTCLPFGLSCAPWTFTKVVATSPDPMEWENYHSEISADSDPVRRFPLRMGNSVQRGEHERLMDPTTTTPHQLPRIVGSRPGLEIISKGSAASGSPATVGQLHSCGIHQQPGGNHLPSTQSSGENTVVVGPGEGHHNHSPTHPRCVQHCSRLRVQDGEGQVRLDVGSSSVPQDQRSPETSRDRLIRFTADLPAATVFQLEARPPSSSSGCLSTGLESVERVCQPPMVPGGTSTEQGGIPTGSGNSGSPSVESPDMVSCLTQDVERLPSPSLSSGGSNAEGETTEEVGGHPTTSRLACLRAKFRDSCLSSEASNLMLASWRSKSSQTYDSLFNKWIRWCGERHRDPVSGPIADVANFLAHLFEEGYQSRSLNSFRSAISSVHDPVDGVEVGKHPTISRLLKGAFHSRPPLPRYTSTWNVQVVLQYLEGLGPSNTLPRKQLTFKLTMLMCLTRPSRSADLAFSWTDVSINQKELFSYPQHWPSSHHRVENCGSSFFRLFLTMCPVETLRCYEQATASLRPEDTSKLFVAIVKPHKPVASCTIAQWLRETLKLAGIDVSIFAGHSTRRASTSAAAGAGVTTADIMKAADWSTESVFRRHYYCPSHDASFGRAVLSTSSPG